MAGSRRNVGTDRYAELHPPTEDCPRRSGVVERLGDLVGGLVRTAANQTLAVLEVGRDVRPGAGDG
jgi:hypothetical protein